MTGAPDIRAYGWRDFDTEVVKGLVRGDEQLINRDEDGWLACPLRGHQHERLPWKDGDYRKGSEPCGDPPASFRASPTYVLTNALDNFIAGRELIADAIGGKWGKAETSRLGNENSEDAVTWNVLRSLQEAGCLSIAAKTLAGADTTSEPELYFWGRHIGLTETDKWAELQAIRDELEPGKRQQTEPDACLHIGGWGWVLIEAKFGSGTDVYKDASRVEEWIGRYSAGCPGLFNDHAVRAAELRDFPQQLLRNVAFAHKLKRDDEIALVVALVRERHTTDVATQANRLLTKAADVEVRQATWEDLHAALGHDDLRLSQLRLYMEGKSYGLRRAFAI